jgi:hypothetical protein
LQYRPDPSREQNIRLELDKYKQLLQEDLLKLIAEEKKKEEDRESFYNKITDDEEKNKTEIMMNLQRSESSRKVVALKQ